MSEAATTLDACDVCAGRLTLKDARVTCSEHFLEQLFPEEARKRIPDQPQRQYDAERGV